MDELLTLGLVTPQLFEADHYHLADWAHVWRVHTERERLRIAESAERLADLPRIFAMLPRPLNGDEGGVEFMRDAREANAAIAVAVADVRSHISTAHPIDRPVELLDRVLTTDIERLRRGVKLRTIYPDSARSRGPESQWAAAVTQHGAEVRTLAGPFQRAVIVDDTFAMIADTKPTTRNELAGWKITHPGMISFVAEAYQHHWQRAEPWMGGHSRPAASTVTTARVRAILRGLSAGKTQSAIAQELGVSARTVSNSLAPVYEALDIEPGDAFRLALWWSTTKERTLD
ncbi:LuxR C-terminal-related transcriptional regulator [Streptomyces sp. SID1121]|uniref:LuxR C-terminal-related transcriptional regulator n=1 Tax=Streptomyces sp. SID1121 TaxID=3425888 RepID=UPI0040574C22